MSVNVEVDIGEESVLLEDHRILLSGSRGTCSGEARGQHTQSLPEVMTCHFPCNLLLDSAFSSTSGSWLPVVDAEPFLYRRTVGLTVVETIVLIKNIIMFYGRWELCMCFSNVNNVPFQDSFKVCLHPRGTAISCEGDVFHRNLIISPRRRTVISDVRERDHAALGCTLLSFPRPQDCAELFGNQQRCMPKFVTVTHKPFEFEIGNVPRFVSWTDRIGGVQMRV